MGGLVAPPARPGNGGKAAAGAGSGRRRLGGLRRPEGLSVEAWQAQLRRQLGR